MVDKPRIEAAFLRYIQEQSKDAIDEAIDASRPVVATIADEHWHKMNKVLHLGDIESWGLTGAWQAVLTFDPAKNQATPYLHQKVRWAVLDGAREWGWFSRVQSKKGYRMTRIGDLRGSEKPDWRDEPCELSEGEPVDEWWIYRDFAHNALRGESGKYRLLFDLVGGLDMTLREAGKVIGVSESRACQMWQRARERLREVVMEELAA